MAETRVAGDPEPDLARQISGLSAEQRARFEAIMRRKRSESRTIRPAPGPGPWPASFGQERMWVGDDLAPAVNVYASAVRLRGRLSLPALRTCLVRVAGRHEALRTTFRLSGGRLLQHVDERVRVPVRVVDLTGADIDPGLASLRRLMRAEARRPFDLEVGPLVRVVVYRLAPADHCVLLALHHSVTDGWSNGVLAAEVSACYADLVASHPWSPAPLPLQYKDFAAWQRERLAGPEAEALARFWRDATRDLPHLALPVDAPVAGGTGAGTGSAGTGANHTIDLGPELSGRLARLRLAEGGSPFMLVLAALATVLRAVTGQSDLVVGTLSAGRARRELESLIGYFVNVLPLRLRLPPAPRFRDVWSTVRETVQAAYAHQEMPYETVLEQLRADGQAGPAAPIRVLCVAHPEAPVLRLPGMQTEVYDVDLGTVPFDLVVEVRDRPDGLRVAIQYDTGLFTEPTIRVLADHLVTALLGAADNPDTVCADLLAPALPRPATAGTEPTAPGLHDAIEAQARLRPDAVAVVDGDDLVSYRALNARANQLANELRAAGVRPEDRVAICLPRSAYSVIAMLAVLKAGAAFVVLDPDHPSARHAEILADARPRAMIARSGLPVPAGVAIVLHPDAPPPAPVTGDPGLPIHPDAAAYLCYTSGSDGRAKAVVGLHRGTVNRAEWMSRTYPVVPGEVCAARTSLTFVDAMWETLGPLRAGAVLAIVPSAAAADPVLLADWLAARRVSRLVAVPALIDMLLDAVPDPARRLATVRTWITSGEELHAGLATRFHRCLPAARLLNLYGSTEVSADATAAEVTDPVPSRVPIGRPLSGVSAWVGDDRGRAVPTLVPGEIYVGGQAVARGYHDRPGQTAAVFLPDLYGPPGARCFRTGDLARRRADGDLEYLGRRDAQVKIRGHRVEPGEVELALLRHPAVRAAAVTARPDATGSRALVGYVEAVPGRHADPAALRAFLRGRLPHYLVPSLFVPVDTLPRTGSGKVDRRSLPAAGPGVATAPGDRAAAPRGPVEAVVAATFAEVLGVPEVGREEDFFLAGGHSVLAGQLVRQLSDRLGVRLRLADLFEASSVAAMAHRIGDLPTVAPDRERDPLRPDPARRHEPFPLTEVQEAYYVGRGEDLRLGGVSTHAYLELAVEDFELDRFTAALHQVIERHPMLRAVIRPDGTQQVLADVPAYQVATYDLRGLTGEDARRRLGAIRDEMSHQVLDPHVWPLFDVRTSLLAERALLHVSIDALICDAYSFGLVMAELTTRYRDPGHRPAPLDLTFRDYVLDKVARRGSAEYAAALEHWRGQLSTLPGGPELPVDRQVDRPGGQRFTRREGRLAASAWATMKERATAAGVTPSGALLAAFAEVLTAWSRRPQYTLMLTVFDREPVHPQVAGVVGDFTSLVVLGVDHSRPGTFVDRARGLQHRLWSNLDRSSVSAVTVMREWARVHDRPPELITPVVFTSNLAITGGGASPPGPTGDALGELAYGITQTPQIHLDHQVSEQQGELLFNWDSVDELFPPGVLDDMFGAYHELLARLTARPEAWTRPAHPTIPAGQIARRRTVNAVHVPLPTQCLHEAVVDTAAAYPYRVAVVDGATRMTYAELVRRARQVAHALRVQGARPDRLVGIAASSGWQQVVAALGVLESGAAFLPLEPELPPARFDLLARRGEVSLVLTGGVPGDSLPVIPGVRYRAVDDGTTAGGDRAPIGPVAGPSDLAYTIFTSGSTGEPKGVAIEHRAAANTIAAVNRRFEIGPDDRVLAVSSLSFDLAIYDIFGLLAAGGTVVLPGPAGRRDPVHWARLVRDHRITVWNSVPALAELLVDHAETRDPDALTSLRLVLLSGDWIPVGLPDRIRAMTGARVVSLGGATEGAIWSVWYLVGRVEPRWRSIPYGMPMDNQSMHVLDGEFRDRPDWVAGDLYIGGAGVAREYWRADELTARSFLVHPVTDQRLYRTGDIARYLPDGNLEFLGRQDDQVKINGYRVELGEIEAAIDSTGAVRAAAVVAVDVPGGGRRLAAYLVPADPDGFVPGELRRRLAEMLPDYMVPQVLTVVEALPLTPNGKVDQRALVHRGAEPVPRTPAPPVDDLTNRLCELWRETLSVDTVHPEDNFFAIGGTSLVAIRMLSRLQEAFGVRLPLSDLFRSPTVTALAEAIVATRRSTGSAQEPPPRAEPDPAARHEPFPLTDVQQAYWLGRNANVALGGVATHSYVELDAEDLDVSRLERALRRLVDRHPALRTVVRPDGLQQVLVDVPPYRITVADLRGAQPAEAGRARESLREQMSHEVRDASRWPLFDLRAHRLDDRTRLHLSLDLLMVDAHSVQLLTEELLHLYADPAVDLPAPGLTFRDYVLAVQRLRDTAGYRRAQDYWRDRARDLPPPPALPLIRRPEELTATAFTRVGVELDEPSWRRLRDWAGAAGLTPSGLLCAAFCHTLAAWSESGRFTLNVTTFNRMPVHPDIEAVVGDFTATTLLGVACGTSFVDTARHVQEQLWRDLEHRIVSGVEVQRILRRDPAARVELMPVVFTSTLLSQRVRPLPAGGFVARPVYAISQTPQVLLDHQVSEHAGRLVCTWDHVAAAFPPGLVATMAAAFRGLLLDLAAATPPSRTRRWSE